MTHPSNDASLETWARAGRDLSEQLVAALEARLTTSPDDIETRSKLIGSYFHKCLRPRGDEPIQPSAAEALLRHGSWMIEHHPELQVTGLVHSTAIQTLAVQERLTALWNQAVDRHPDDARVLRHAASFFGFFGPRRDEQRQRELLERACAADPKDVEALQALARAREHEARFGTKSASAQEEDRRSAAALYERALDVNQDPERRVSVLNDVALAALASGQLDKAERCAREALTALSSTPRNWNWGNVWHKCHGVLGIIALRAGDVESARRHLIDSGRTPGSPQLSSFGPNMGLAKELLEHGERDVVLEFLGLLEVFWQGDRQLQTLLGWRGMIERGKQPDFGANLLY